MLLNWCEEITNIDPSINFRATGGWVKTVTGLDKSVLNGFSLVGEFVKAGDYKTEFSDGLYLDCNKEGKKSKRAKFWLSMVSCVVPFIGLAVLQLPFKNV